MTHPRTLTPQPNLRELIRAAADEVGNTYTTAIAERVAAVVPQAALRQALAQALPLLVREVVTTYRPRGALARPAVPLPIFQPPTVDLQAADPQARPPTATMPTRPAGNRKATEIHAAGKRVLEAPYATADGHKQLGDCTHDDLHSVAGRLEELAQQNTARARAFRHLSTLLTTHGADRAGPAQGRARPDTVGFMTASVGSPLSDGHKHARALRAVCKAVLREMWCESRRLHQEM